MKIADQYRLYFYYQEAIDEIVYERYEIVTSIIRMTIGPDKYTFGEL